MQLEREGSNQEPLFKCSNRSCKSSLALVWAASKAHVLFTRSVRRVTCSISSDTLTSLYCFMCSSSTRSLQPKQTALTWTVFHWDPLLHRCQWCHSTGAALLLLVYDRNSTPAVVHPSLRQAAGPSSSRWAMQGPCWWRLLVAQLSLCDTVGQILLWLREILWKLPMQIVWYSFPPKKTWSYVMLTSRKLRDK